MVFSLVMMGMNSFEPKAFPNDWHPGQTTVYYHRLGLFASFLWQWKKTLQTLSPTQLRSCWTCWVTGRPGLMRIILATTYMVLRPYSLQWQVYMRRVKSLVSLALTYLVDIFFQNNHQAIIWLNHQCVAKVGSTNCHTAWYRTLSGNIQPYTSWPLQTHLFLGASSAGLRKSVLELVASLKSKSSSRGCGPVLWKWVLRQPWRSL